MLETTKWRLGDLGEIFDGPHATPHRVDVGPYFLNIASLQSGRLDLEASDRISPEQLVQWTRRVTPQADDLLFSYETRLGEAALMPEGVEACLGRRMALLRPRVEVVEPRFLLYYYLSPSFQHLIGQHTIHGATVNRIGLSTMANWELSLPSLTEQRAIAEVLGALDDKMAANRGLQETLERLAVSVVAACPPSIPLYDLVVQNKATLEPAGISADLISLYSLPAYDAGSMPERVRPASVKSGKFAVTAPSVLVSKLNPRFPRLWDVPALDTGINVASTEFVVLEPKHCSTSVLWAIVSQPSFSAALESRVAGTSGSHQRVRPADLLAAEVVDPRALSPSLLETITGLGRRRLMARRESRALAAVRDALLPLLMSGRVRVKDAERVVADAGRTSTPLGQLLGH